MARGDAKVRLLDAAVRRIRTHGYASTTVDDLCADAGVTKGAFFHHFAGKDDLGVAVVHHWAEITAPLFERAPYHLPDDPARRVLAYVGFRRDLLQGPVAEVTCLAGTLVQEAYATHPAIREACGEAICGHAATLVDDVRDAMAARGLVGFTPESLALYTQAVLQGAFVLAKATGSTDVAVDCVDHLYRHLAGLFGLPAEPPARTPEEPP